VPLPPSFSMGDNNSEWRWFEPKRDKKDEESEISYIEDARGMFDVV
jgi:hypothetical protein